MGRDRGGKRRNGRKVKVWGKGGEGMGKEWGRDRGMMMGKICGKDGEGMVMDGRVMRKGGKGVGKNGWEGMGNASEVYRKGLRKR